MVREPERPGDRLMAVTIHRRGRAAGLVAGLVLALAVPAGCASTASTTTPGTTGPTTPSTTRPATTGGGGCGRLGGSRCAGPEPVGQALIGPLIVSPDGRTLSGRFQCGGQLTVDETSTGVTLTYIASAVGPGAMSCALVPLSVHLGTALDNRPVVDGVTHQRLAVRPGSIHPIQ